MENWQARHTGLWSQCPQHTVQAVLIWCKNRWKWVGSSTVSHESQECDEASLKNLLGLRLCWWKPGIHDDADDCDLFCSGQILKRSLQFWTAHFNCWYISSETNFNFEFLFWELICKVDISWILFFEVF